MGARSGGCPAPIHAPHGASFQASCQSFAAHTAGVTAASVQLPLRAHLDDDLEAFVGLCEGGSAAAYKAAGGTAVPLALVVAAVEGVSTLLLCKGRPRSSLCSCLSCGRPTVTPVVTPSICLLACRDRSHLHLLTLHAEPASTMCLLERGCPRSSLCSCPDCGHPAVAPCICLLDGRHPFSCFAQCEGISLAHMSWHTCACSSTRHTPGP